MVCKYISSYLVPKHGGFEIGLYHELIAFTIMVHILTSLAVFGIN